VSYKVRPRELSSEASIAAAEAEGVSYKVRPRELSSEASIAAAEAEGVSYKVRPRELSSEASIAAAEAEGVSYKMVPHRFYSADDVKAAHARGQLALQASDVRIERRRKYDAMKSAERMNNTLELLARRPEVNLDKILDRVEKETPRQASVALHFLNKGRCVYVFVAGAHRAPPTAKQLDPPLVLEGREVLQLVGAPPDGASCNESQRYLVEQHNPVLRAATGKTLSREEVADNFVTIELSWHPTNVEANIQEGDTTRALQVDEHLSHRPLLNNQKFGCDDGTSFPGWCLVGLHASGMTAEMQPRCDEIQPRVACLGQQAATLRPGRRRAALPRCATARAGQGGAEVACDEAPRWP